MKLKDIPMKMNRKLLLKASGCMSILLWIIFVAYQVLSFPKSATGYLHASIVFAVLTSVVLVDFFATFREYRIANIVSCLIWSYAFLAWGADYFFLNPSPDHLLQLSMMVFAVMKVLVGLFCAPPKKSSSEKSA